jgi:hypothetical protein
MVLLRDVGQVEARLGLFGDSVNLGASYVQGLRRIHHGHGNQFGHTRWYSLVMWVKWKLILVHLEIVLICAQDRCTDCGECTTGMEIILGTPDGTPS